jgi:hypothetical protein
MVPPRFLDVQHLKFLIVGQDAGACVTAELRSGFLFSLVSVAEDMADFVHVFEPADPKDGIVQRPLPLSRREAVPTHYFGHLYAVGKPASRRVDDLRRLAKISWTDGGRRNQAQCPRGADSIVIEPVNGAAGNAKCLSRSELEWFPVDSPGQHSVDSVNGLFVMVVTMCGSRQALSGGDH